MQPWEVAETSGTYEAPRSNDVCVNYFDMLFRDPPTPENPTFDAQSVPTPAFEKIFDTQEFNDDTKRWAYLMIGRMFFPLHMFECWQRALFVVGAGGSGKSTIITWLKFGFIRCIRR